jgi:hypothetical protein
MPGCHRRYKQSIQVDVTRIWHQKLNRRVQGKKKKRHFIKERKRMDERGIRKYGIAKETK